MRGNETIDNIRAVKYTSICRYREYERALSNSKRRHRRAARFLARLSLHSRSCGLGWTHECNGKNPDVRAVIAKSATVSSRALLSVSPWTLVTPVLEIRVTDCERSANFLLRNSEKKECECTTQLCVHIERAVTVGGQIFRINMKRCSTTHHNPTFNF